MFWSTAHTWFVLSDAGADAHFMSKKADDVDRYMFVVPKPAKKFK